MNEKQNKEFVFSGKQITVVIRRLIHRKEQERNPQTYQQNRLNQKWKYDFRKNWQLIRK